MQKQPHELGGYGYRSLHVQMQIEDALSMQRCMHALARQLCLREHTQVMYSRSTALGLRPLRDPVRLYVNNAFGRHFAQRARRGSSSGPPSGSADLNNVFTNSGVTSRCRHRTRVRRPDRSEQARAFRQSASTFTFDTIYDVRRPRQGPGPWSSFRGLARAHDAHRPRHAPNTGRRFRNAHRHRLTAGGSQPGHVY